MKPTISIFNDVIGPIMRGPSSSHTAAGWRVANMALQILNDELASAHIEFDRDGQWATNYAEQGTVLGMNGGLLNIAMADDQMKRTEDIAADRGIKISYAVSSFENTHPNSMQLTLYGRSGKTTQVLAASLGGGSFELQKIDGCSVKMSGDTYAVLLWSTDDLSASLSELKPAHSKLTTSLQGQTQLSILQSAYPFLDSFISAVQESPLADKTASLIPILPIISGLETDLPFSDIASLVAYAADKNMSLGELGLLYEKHRSGLSKELLIEKMEHIINLIESSIQTGLAGTQHADRILHQQSHKVSKAESAGKILQGSIINAIVKNVAAIMESKSALEVVVANPTAGSCGTVGGVMAAVAEELKSTKADKIKAYFATGLVGAYFAMGPGFSAEEHGCQVETGASAGMAAAGIVELFGGSAEQALGAASIAIQNTIGLVCDPIANRVEAPCLGKNTSAAVNALSSATMASSGFAYLIPLDQVLETVSRVSAQMPSSHKCTGTGGLAITPAALALKEKLLAGNGELNG